MPCDLRVRREIQVNFLLSTLLLISLASAPAALAQSKADEEVVRKLPKDFCSAWAKHDGHALAKIMAKMWIS